MMEREPRQSTPAYQHFVDELGKGFREGKEFTDRGVDDYERFLGISMGEMRDKTVLDLGSSTAERFSKEAAILGVKVVSLNPALKDGAPQTPEFKKRSQHRSVAGVAQAMPFANETFDYVTAFSSLPMYSPFNLEEYKKWIKEIARILKLKGKAYLFPVTKEYYSYIVEALKPNPEIGIISKEKVIMNNIDPFPKGTEVYRLILKKNFSPA